MKRITVGSVIKKARESKQLDREKLAKKLNITSGYLGHLERDGAVRLSGDLIGRLIKVLGARMAILKRLADRHNAKMRRIVAQYPSSKAA